MVVYLFNLIWTIIMASLSLRYSKLKYNNAIDKTIKMPNLIFTILILTTFMSFYALRWKTGTDFGAYYSFYYTFGQSDISDLVGTRDWGFSVLTSLIYKLSPDNFILYNYILAGITYIPIVFAFRKYSSNFTFTLFLYITMLTYYWPYNGVRQSIAVSICFVAYSFLYKKKYFKYSISVLIAYLFHSTALLMIPIMFVVTKRAWSKPIIITLSLLIISLSFLPSLWSHIIGFLELAGQEKMANDYREYRYDDDGANIIRIAVAWVPIVISFIFYKSLKRNNPTIDLIINMSLMGGIFMLFATQITVLARFSAYFGIFSALLIPEFSGLFKPKERVLFIYLVCLLYFIYMCLLLPVDSDLLPYRFIFNEMQKEQLGK